MNKKNVPYDMLLILFGIISILLCYAFAFPFTIDIIFLLVGVMVVFLLLSWIIKSGNKKAFYAFLILFIVFLVITRDSLVIGFQNLYNQMTEVYSTYDNYYFQKYNLDRYTNYQMSTQWCILSVFTIYILAACITIFEHKGYLLNFLLSFVLFIPTIMYHISQNFIIDALIFIYWILLFFHHTMQKKGVQIQLNRTFIVRLMIVLLLFVFNFQLIYPQSKFVKNAAIEQARLDLETKYRQKIQKAFSDKTGEVNLNNAKDRYYFDTLQMNLYSEQPDDYYIKTFSGSVYEDNTWKLLEESSYHERNLNWLDVFTWYTRIHQLNPSMHSNEIYTLKIEDKREANDYAPIPYNTAVLPAGFSNQYDAYGIGKKDSYIYDVWNSYEASSYIDIPMDYVAFVNAEYLQVPPNVTRFFQKKSIYINLEGNDVNEIVEHVKDYLSHNTSYTLKPGATPTDEDFVTYFLGTNKKGYCVHYASSATLMLRYMGIPARYVEGFHVDKTKFDEENEAAITDREAHAWVEIFDINKGWIPVEVTPASSQTSTTTPKTEGNEQNKPQNTQKQETPKEQTKQEEPVKEKTDVEKTQVIHMNWDVILFGFSTIVLAILILLIHKIRYHRWMKAMTQHNYKAAVKACDTYYQKWMPYGMHISSRSKDIIDKARYSQHDLTQKEYQVVYSEMMNGVYRIYKSLKFYQKLYLIFILGIK